MRILAIETSCDETAAAVIEDGRRILSNVIASQTELHARYGGVFPEMASRAHIEAILPVIEQAMREAYLGFDDLDAVAVTHGPGLAGSLLVGVNAAKGLALGRKLPLLGINHLEAHIYAHWLETRPDGVETEEAARTDLEFPLLALVVSGGHTELVMMHDHARYEYLGGTLDDAAGEAFDKVGRLLGLPYPGGPAIQTTAQNGHATAFRFPRAWLDDSYDFSFSGLKTAMLRIVESYSDPPRGQQLANLAASFQAAVVDVLSAKAARAAEEFKATAVLLCGGVSANQALRTTTAERASIPVHYPPPILCTDNAAMVGACAYRHFIAGERAGWDLDVLPGLRLVERRRTARA
ncbi:MAG TPA: tRNA (adenosine(37)-N6)-threonylcarbamoyltransferase complex transferase subunit TsaD [Chloroflexi bacterium]|nr:tRNA (adenosine(37)-N6)-threonylcarbamoyltransferase complex transferase subunit TsaD [Chloroflexota bacterium]